MDEKILQPIGIIQIDGFDGSETLQNTFKAGASQDFQESGIIYNSNPVGEVVVEDLILNRSFLEIFGYEAEEIESNRIKGSQVLKIFHSYPGKIFDHGHSSGILSAFSVVTTNDEVVKNNLLNVKIVCVVVFGGDMFYICSHDLWYSQRWPQRRCRVIRSLFG